MSKLNIEFKFAEQFLVLDSIYESRCNLANVV